MKLNLSSTTNLFKAIKNKKWYSLAVPLLGTSYKYYVFAVKWENYQHFVEKAPIQSSGQFVCLCWGFTAQSTQWSHIERGQFT